MCPAMSLKGMLGAGRDSGHAPGGQPRGSGCGAGCCCGARGDAAVPGEMLSVPPPVLSLRPLPPLAARGPGAAPPARRRAQRSALWRRGGGAGSTCRERRARSGCGWIPAPLPATIPHSPAGGTPPPPQTRPAGRIGAPLLQRRTLEHLSFLQSGSLAKDSPCPGRLVAEPPIPPGGTFTRFPFHGGELSQPVTKHTHQQSAAVRKSCSAGVTAPCYPPPSSLSLSVLALCGGEGLFPVCSA